MPDLRARLQDSVGSKFRIIRELTGGGMSRVFLAEDAALEREVVIKVLSPHLVDDTLLQRFRSEVLQTARLQHPTIVSVYEIGTISGMHGQHLPFYVMPYVRGESLRSRLKHEGALSIGTTIRVLRNVLDALVHAHAHGVLHRDVKPENIFLSGNTAVLADFGVAKAVAGPVRSAALTSPGMTVGTPAYMAPQQIAGEEGSDVRADLYAVAVVAFEMLTGRLPWDATNTSEMIAAKARGTLSPVRSLRADVPDGLASVIERSLSWDPSKRPASAGEMLHAIETVASTTTPSAARPIHPVPHPSRLAGGAIVLVAAVAVLVLGGLSWLRRADGPPPAVRLAVLGLAPDSGVEPDSTLGHQLYHLLVAGLYPVPGLELVNETRISRMYELEVARDNEIEQMLKAEGFDSALVMEAQPTTNGAFHLRLVLKHLRDGVREAIGDSVALGSLGLLAPDSARVLAGVLASQVVSRFNLTRVERNVRETGSNAAALARERGRKAMSSRSPTGIRVAIQHFRDAISLDSSYAQAYADLADAISLALFYRYRTDEPPYRMAATASQLADRAILLQPGLAEGLTARGYIGMIAGAPRSFVRDSYDRAKALHPENPNSQLWYVGLLALDGDFAGAVDSLSVMVKLDPESPSKRVSIALYSLPLSRYADIVENAAIVRRLQPDFPFAAALEVWGRVLSGAGSDACLAVDVGPYLGARAACLERTLGRGAAQAIVDSLFRVTSRAVVDSSFDASLPASEMAMLSALHREWESAGLWLRAAFQESPIGIDPRFLRSGVFNDELVRLGDSLRAEAWRRVTRRAPEQSRTVR